LVEFIEHRRKQNASITTSTLKKDLTTIRMVMKHAVMRGIVSTLPLFPGAHVLGKLERNPRPWFEPREWNQLQAVAQQRIKDEDNPRAKRQRQELLDFITFLHGTCLRVDEARAIRVKDCAVKTRAHSPHPLLRRTMSRTIEYLEIVITKSKTGRRVGVARPGAVPVYRRLADGKKPGDLLFAEHHRDGFRELLIAAGLRSNGFGVTRNLKSMRPTAISHWLLDQPGIDLAWLAANVGTSIAMLNDFYLRRLGIQRDGLDWVV
jgi:integrase